MQVIFRKYAFCKSRFKAFPGESSIARIFAQEGLRARVLELEADAPDGLNVRVGSGWLELGAQVADMRADGFLVRCAQHAGRSVGLRGGVVAGGQVKVSFGEDALRLAHEGRRQVELGAGQLERRAVDGKAAAGGVQPPCAEGEGVRAWAGGGGRERRVGMAANGTEYADAQMGEPAGGSVANR